MVGMIIRRILVMSKFMWYKTRGTKDNGISSMEDTKLYNDITLQSLGHIMQLSWVTTLIIKKLKFSVEQGRVVKTLNIIKN